MGFARLSLSAANKRGRLTYAAQVEAKQMGRSIMKSFLTRYKLGGRRQRRLSPSTLSTYIRTHMHIFRNPTLTSALWRGVQFSWLAMCHALKCRATATPCPTRCGRRLHAPRSCTGSHKTTPHACWSKLNRVGLRRINAPQTLRFSASSLGPRR